MADDMVERVLKFHETIDDIFDSEGCVVCGAADEIVRLRAAGDALVAVMRCGASDERWNELIDAWQEARRG